MKNILRRLAVLFCLMLALALPAFAEGEKGEANITPQTTMKELRENPSIKGAGIYTYVYVWERDCGLLKSSKDNDTMLEVIGKESINSCVAGMNFLIDTYNTGTQITYKLYTPEEIAEEMNMPVERVREILKISQEPVSLETPIGEEEDSHLGDFIQDDNVPVPADAAAFTLLKEQLVEVLSTLTEREQKVLRLRFGLDDGRARTLEEVGKEFSVTRERIRQIEAKALRKLRHPSRSRKLKDYLD